MFDEIKRLINECESFDEIDNLIDKLSLQAKQYEKIDEFFDSLIECDEKEIVAKLNEFITFASKYGYPLMDSQRNDIIKRLQEIIKLPQEKIKDALVEFVAALKSGKYGVVEKTVPDYGYPAKFMETVNIFDQEIASPVKNGATEITESDLHEIASNWARLREIVKPPITLGHISFSDDAITDSGKMLNSSLPAFGWVENLRVEKGKLIADFKDVPKRVADIIRASGYRRLSPEIYINFRDKDGNVYGKVLRAVALLGMDIPEMKDLKDLEVLYCDETGKLVIAGCEKQKEKPEVDMDRFEKIEKTTQELYRENILLKVEKFMEQNKTRILPAYAEKVKAVLIETAMNDAQLLTFSEDGKERKLSIHDALKEIFSALPEYVSFEEKSKTELTEEDKELQTVEKYMQERGLTSHVQAYEEMRAKNLL